MSVFVNALVAPSLTSDSRPGSNLPSVFERLVNRNTSGSPREVAATELVRAVLQTSVSAMTAVTQWLAEAAELEIDTRELLWHAETERPIAGKRDDLRLEGRDPRAGAIIALFTIEVKVESGFHWSSPTPDVDTSDPEVPQLVNYDAWLRRVTAPHVAGFVLARTDTTEALKRFGLERPWRSIRWDQLAEVLANVEGDDDGPVLARHCSRFIRRNIADSEDFMTPRLELADLALLQAYAQHGRTTQKRVTRIVEPLVALLDNPALTPHTPQHQTQAFGFHARDTVYVSLNATEPKAPPYLVAGLATLPDLRPCVWIESQPGHPSKATTQELVARYFDALKDRNCRWDIVAQDGSDWRDLQLDATLGELLDAADQSSFLTEFTRSALDDLQSVGLIDAIRTLAGRSTEGS